MAAVEPDVVATRMSLGQIKLADTLSPVTLREPSPKRSRRSLSTLNTQTPSARKEGKEGKEGMVTSETPDTPAAEIADAADQIAVGDLTDHETLFSMPLTIVIFGATGDLAKKKLFPSLYKLCVQGHLPRDLSIVGYGRRAVDLNEFIAKQCVNVVEDERWSTAEYFSRISFHAGGYDAPTSYEALHQKLGEYEAAHESGLPGNRLFFLSVPPTVFGTVAEMISQHSRASNGGFTRLMIEKPFGRDSTSFEELNQLTVREPEPVSEPSPCRSRPPLVSLKSLTCSASARTGAPLQ